MFVIDNNPALFNAACYALYTDRFMRGLSPLPAALHQRRLNHDRLWAKAKKERRILNKTTAFVPHDISVADVKQMRDYFASYPEIKAVHIARKVVEQFPDFPHYFIVLTYQFPRQATELPIPSNQIRAFVRDGLAFSGDYTLKIMGKSAHLRGIKRVENALIYER